MSEQPDRYDQNREDSPELTGSEGYDGDEPEEEDE